MVVSSLQKSFFLALALLFLLAGVPAGAADRGLALTDAAPLSDKVLGTYHALIVGINAYQEWNPLQTAVHDATALRDTLVAQYGFDDENVVLRTDEAATRAQIIRDLRSLASSLEDKDNLLIYFAGHGQLDDLTGDGYWIPVEGKLKEPSSWISHAVLKGVLGSEKVRAKNVVVIADSCYSGTLLRGGPSLLKMEDRSYMDKLAEAASRRSRQVITSGGLEPVADGGRDGHSLFAYYLLTALRENDREVVDLENLFHTRVWAPVTQVGDQRPNVGRLKTPMDEDGQFVLRNQGLLERRAARAEEDEKRNAREEARLRGEAEERKRLQEELARLEEERRRLEEERRLLEEKKKLEAERLALEREKQRLALETERKRLELEQARAEQGAANASGARVAALPETETLQRPERRRITVAALPWKFDYHCHYNRKITLDYTHELILGVISRSRGFRLTHSRYPSDSIDARDVQAVSLDPSDSDRLWRQKGLFSKSEPDPETAARIGRQLGVDAVFLTRITSQGDCDAKITAFLVDTKSGKLRSETAMAATRLFSLEMKRLTRKLLMEHFAEHRNSFQ